MEDDAVAMPRVSGSREAVDVVVGGVELGGGWTGRCGLELWGAG